MPIITKVDERGRDLIINDNFSIPKDKVTLIKHPDFVEMRFEHRYYSASDGKLNDYIEVRHETCQDPNESNNDDLFEALYRLKD